MSILPALSARHVDHRSYPVGVAYMDGQYLPMAEAKISVLDYGFLHSDATYDVAHVWKGNFFRLDDHLVRFCRGMEQLHMSVPYDKEQMREILHNCVALSGLKDAYVEFICTRGTSPTFSRDPRDAENRFIAFAIPFGSVANEEQRKRGLNLAVTDILRIPPASLDPTVKNYHWLDMVRALYAGYAIEADSAVLVDQEGNLSEGPGFNIFVVRDGEILTPKGSVLHGITRQTIFDICAGLNIPCEEQAIPVDVLKAADEVFITSTAGGVMAVTRLDGQVVGDGMIGTITQRITKCYWDMHTDARYASTVRYPDIA